jgi:steroid delta-isomerase-like uncharacterized protein
MSAEAHKALVRRFYKDAVDAGNLALIDTLFAPHYTFYPAGSSEPIDRQTFKAFLHAFRTAFGFYHTIEDQVADDNKVVTRWTVHGTHQGTFQDLPATGKQVTYMGITIFHFAADTIEAGWSSFDELGMLRQLGMLPALVQTSA